jgi:hypothetical protein
MMPELGGWDRLGPILRLSLMPTSFRRERPAGAEFRTYECRLLRMLGLIVRDTHNRVRFAAVPSPGDEGRASQPTLDIYRKEFGNVSIGWPNVDEHSRVSVIWDHRLRWGCI